MDFFINEKLMVKNIQVEMLGYMYIQFVIYFSIQYDFTIL